ncbi:phage tail protein [Leptospira kirschneri]|uniref:phage tail protein n=1 Tax=Leptospira kirschneri TaxID=29507 RepID=UPI00398B6427
MSSFYVLKSSDTLQRLSSRFFGNWELWLLILDQNPHILDWKNLEAGIQIEIPDPRTEDVFHTIVSGDTYESLSLLYYGTEHFSGRIRQENDNIQPYENIGADLFISALVSKNDLLNAKRRIS